MFKALGTAILAAALVFSAASARPGRGVRSTTNQRENFKRPTMSTQQQANLTKLQQDLAAIKQGSQVTPAQKESLAQSLMTLAEGTTRPSQASVSKLSSDLSQAMADSKITPKEQAQLMQDVAVVLNSANIPPEELQAVMADAQAILLSSGVDQSDVEVIMSDLQAIANELTKS